MNVQDRIPFHFRLLPENRLTLPVLFHVLEKEGWDRFFEIGAAPRIPSFRRLPGKGISLFAYSFMTPQAPTVAEEIRRIRNRWKDGVFLVAGGPHPTGDPGQALKIGFDTVIAGEAEDTLGPFCRAFLEDPDPLRGKTLISKNNASLECTLPFTAVMRTIPPLEITRGCPHRCRFCQTAGVPVRHRSIASIEEYLDGLVRRGAAGRAGFISPSGLQYGSFDRGKPNPGAIAALLSAGKARGIRHVEYGIFPSEIRPETVTAPLLEILKPGCSNRKLTFGAQSGSDSLLRRLGRGHRIGDVENASALAAKAGFRPLLDFIVGFPGETDDDQEATLLWMKRLASRYSARIQTHHFIPLSGTDLAGGAPAPLSDRTVRTLERYVRDGICTDWWKKDQDISRRVVRFREEMDGMK